MARLEMSGLEAAAVADLLSEAVESGAETGRLSDGPVTVAWGDGEFVVELGV